MDQILWAVWFLSKQQTSVYFSNAIVPPCGNACTQAKPTIWPSFRMNHWKQEKGVGYRSQREQNESNLSLPSPIYLFTILIKCNKHIINVKYTVCVCGGGEFLALRELTFCKTRHRKQPWKRIIRSLLVTNVSRSENRKKDTWVVQM